ncbi:hypothetical protein DRP04_08270 [Archaeoglobales archaeon]|nr:MAG: hypothetical protein DRP04_08270 [Archaeoglobales archaeon]
MGRWEDFIKVIFTRILPFFGFLLVITGYLYKSFFEENVLKLEEGLREVMYGIIYILILILVAFTAYAAYNLAISKDIRDILDERLSKSNPHRNPNSKKKEEEEEEIRTSGAGALVGMIGGGLIGLPFGPTGVILGGLLGAIIGNQIEYEQERERKKRMKK